MISWFVNLRFSRKILIIIVMMMMAGVMWGGYNSYLGYCLERDDTMLKNQSLVESTVTIIEGLNKDVENGKIALPEAQDLAKDMLRSARYEGSQYFWINDLNGTVLMHPILPQLENQDLTTSKPEVHALFQKFAELSKNNPSGAQYYYDWSKPGEDKSKKFKKSSYVMQIKSWGWVVGTGVYIHDLEERAYQFFFKQCFFIILFGISLIAGYFIATAIFSKPLVKIAAGMKDLANGNLSVDVPYLGRKDEVGMIAESFAIFKSNAIDKQNLEREQERLKLKAAQEKRDMMMKTADDFENNISNIIEKLGASSHTMFEKAIHMVKISNNNVHTSQIVAAAATEADSNVQTVAAATEELSASSAEIARQITSVAQKSSRAAAEASTTNDRVKELNELADSIGEVVGAIKKIAEQTNLLALNATIEAARAGEAGKGFAVVADEVKKLATETAKKTGEIDYRVVRIQEAIKSSVDAMQLIISNVQDIDHATSTVASAVEEQNAATAEIGRNVCEASQGTQEVSRNILEVKLNAENTGDSAKEVEVASQEIGAVTDQLNRFITQFLDTLRNDKTS
ncbi:MAG: cache domain-containing protein [Alphaproteobacteria bacterium]|nr:cache domain-containing protein [Alphaproteobacteria bacterium]